MSDIEKLFSLLSQAVAEGAIDSFSLNYAANMGGGLSGWSMTINGGLVSEFPKGSDPIRLAVHSLHEWYINYWCTLDDVTGGSDDTV